MPPAAPPSRTTVLVQALSAAAAYTAMVFAAGFALGTVRVLALEPALGPAVAVALEIPIMLAVSWLACGLVLRRSRLGPALAPRATMAAASLAFLIALEIGLVLTLTGETIREYLAEFATAHGALGLAGQLAFAVFPVIRHRRPAPRPSSSGGDTQPR